MGRISVFFYALALGLAAPAGFAAGSPLSLVSRIDPVPVSDTASGGLQLASFPGIAPPSLSADGRYAVFLSAASNLVPGQRDVDSTPESDGQDVFLADLVAGTVTLVSHAIGRPDTSGNLGSSAAVISADGRWVVFESAASDLTPGQTTETFPFVSHDLFLYDRVAGTTAHIAATGEPSSTFGNLGTSADGRYVTFDSSADLVAGANYGFSNVFLYDRVAGTIRLVSHVPGAPTNGVPGGYSLEPRISADGGFIVFLTNDPSVLPGQITVTSAVLYDRAADTSKLIGTADGAELSADGNYVAFSTQLALWLYARPTGTTTPVGAESLGTPNGGHLFALNADGHFLLFPPGDGSGLAIYDRISQSILPVSRPAGAPPFNGSLAAPALSADGRYAVFSSTDPAWVAGQTDTNTPPDRNFLTDGSDVFLFDRATGKVSLVSHVATGSTTTGNGSSFAPAISGNGARVLYLSQATDLEPGLQDLNQRPDLFAYDVAAASNQAVTRKAPALLSFSPLADSRATALSADGRFVACESAFSSDDGQGDVFLYDTLAKTRLLVDHTRGSAVTAARGVSEAPVLSADGRYVAFFSNARNLVPGANPRGALSLYLFDRITGMVTFVAPTYDELDERFQSKPRLSADGRWLAFVSRAPDLVPGQQGSVSENVFLYDRVTATTLLVSHAAAGLTAPGDGNSTKPLLSADGRYLAFLSAATNLLAGERTDGNGNSAAFLYDRVTGATTLLSHLRGSPLDAAPAYDNLAMSADGRYITFNAGAGDLDPGSPSEDGTGFYLYDRVPGTYQRISSAVGPYGQEAEISADGGVVAFPSSYSLLPEARPGLFLYDRVARTLSLAAANDYLGVFNGTVALSGDGRYVAFASDTFGLIPGLTRTAGWDGTDVYLLDRATGSTILIDRFQGSRVTAGGFASTPLISADGQTVVFTSGVDLLPGDYNNQSDAYAFALGGAAPGGPVTVPPCALFNGVLRSNVRKPLTAAGACGVPATAKQVQIRLAVAKATGQGNVQLFPGATPSPNAGILRFTRGATRNASFTLTLGNRGFSLLPFVAGNGTVRVSVEVEGYFP